MVLFLLYDVDKSSANVGMSEKSQFGIGIFTGIELPQPGTAVTDQSGIAHLCLNKCSSFFNEPG
jgi:hypothetical protein